MTKKVLLVGHCGPDASYLRQAIKSAAGDVQVAIVEDDNSLFSALDAGVDLVLLNRQLGLDFQPDTGVAMIQVLKQKNGKLRMMLVSNQPEAQAAAVAAGAFPGFGKRQIGRPEVRELLKQALADANGT
jgi:two-component system, chemotaxis family, chemotaxis protein CheY